MPRLVLITSCAVCVLLLSQGPVDGEAVGGWLTGPLLRMTDVALCSRS